MSDDDEEVREGTIIPVESIDNDLINIHEPDDEAEGQSFTLEQLSDLGLAAPLATPDMMRGLYAYRRRTAAAMLDREHDFLYSIQYQEQGKSKEKMTTSYKEAIKFRDMYNVPYKATPRKSGIAKLATAFGVEGTIVEMRGLPMEHNADYCYVKYEVVAKKSGAKATGVGFARRNERGYPMPEHHMIGLADTRAYGRAVLRLAGFGEAGAEEIDNDIQLSGIQIKMGPIQSAVARLSPSSTAQVIDAQVQETRIPVATAQNTAKQPAPAPTRQASPTQQQAPTQPQAQKTAPAEVPMPSPSTITEAQVGKLSSLLKEKLGSRERAQAWLMSQVNVNTSRAVPESAYADLVQKLETMETP